MYGNISQKKKLKGCNDKDISQLELFGEAAWTFVLAIYETEWDQINTADNVTFWSKVKSQFVRNQLLLQSPLVNDNRAVTNFIWTITLGILD